MSVRDGSGSHGGSGCRLDLCLRRCFCGWRGRRGWTMLTSLVLVVPGVWLRAYASGYVRKNAELTTSGPYAYTRNPLYLGSMMIAFGFAWASALWWIAVLLAVLFAVIYIPTIRGEETYLRGQFPGFGAYSAQVPRLLPRLTAAPTAGCRGIFEGALYEAPRVQCCYGRGGYLRGAGGW